MLEVWTDKRGAASHCHDTRRAKSSVQSQAKGTTVRRHVRGHRRTDEQISETRGNRVGWNVSQNEDPNMVKVKQQKIAKRFAVYHGDSCKVIKGIPSDTVGLSVFSPPFSDLYSYSNDLEDMGNCRTRKDFFDHFRFLVPELFRVMMPGRVVAVHCMELPIFKRDSGYVGKWDFPGAIIFFCNSQCAKVSLNPLL